MHGSVNALSLIVKRRFYFVESSIVNVVSVVHWRRRNAAIWQRVVAPGPRSRVAQRRQLYRTQVVPDGALQLSRRAPLPRPDAEFVFAKAVERFRGQRRKLPMRLRQRLRWHTARRRRHDKRRILRPSRLVRRPHRFFVCDERRRRSAATEEETDSQSFLQTAIQILGQCAAARTKRPARCCAGTLLRSRITATARRWQPQ